MTTEGTLVWAAPDSTAASGAVESAAREFNLAVRFCGHSELFDVLRSVRCTLLVIEFGFDMHPGLQLLKQVGERMPRLTTLVGSNDTTVGMVRAAIEAGAADVLSLPLNPQELHKAVIKLNQSGRKSRGANAQAGTIVTVCGARGGLGATTLAVNLAFNFTAIAKAQTALVDLDLQRGDVAAFLNITPLNSLATIATAPGPVDDIFVAGVLTRHPKDVFVLPAPPRIEEADAVGHDHIDLVLRLLAGQFRYVVVDTPRTVSGTTLAAFEQADRILVMMDLSVPGVRAARRTIELLRHLGIPLDRVDPVFSHVGSGGVGSQDAARAVGKEPILIMPRDDAAAGAMNAGTPLNGAQSPLPVAIAGLAAKLAGVALPRRGRGLLRRVFTREARR